MNALDVDTRADVYSLGVILYELLTGTTPLTRDSLKQLAFDEALRLIREQEAPAPSRRISSSDSLPSVAINRRIEPQKLRRLLKGDLDRIVLKALSKDRNQRYETANGFARDIERFLKHEPVTAGPPTTTYRINKFVRRNRPQVIAASLVLLALVAGMIGTTLGLLEARRQTEIARQETDAKEKARIAEAQQRALAEAEMNKAIAFRNKALDALRATTGTDVAKLLGEKKKLTANEHAYLEAIAERWQTFARQEGTDEDSRAVAAEGHFRVAALWQRLGRREEAQPEYEQAVALWQKLTTERPSVPDYHRDLARSHNNLGNLLADLGSLPEAEEQYRKGLAIQEKLAADLPNRPEFRGDQATSHTSLGNLLAGLGRLPEAEEHYRKGLALREKLVAEFPSLPDYPRELAASHNNLGVLLAELERLPEAEEHYRKGLALREKLVAEFPSLPDYPRELAASHINLGGLLAALEKLAEAEEHYRQGLALQEKLAAEFPTFPDYRRELAISHNNLGQLLADRGKQADAEEQYRLGLAIREQLAAEFPAIPSYRIDLGASYCNLGHLLRDISKAKDSLAWYDQAIATLTPIHQVVPRDVTAKLVLRNSHAGRAMAYDQLGKFAQAATDWDRAVELSPPAEQPRARAHRAISQVNAGQVTEAVAEVADLTKSSDWDANQWYDFACVYAVASSKQPDKKELFADSAMQLLKKAVEAGWKDAAQMKTDSDLEPLRERNDFKRLLAELEAKFPPPRDTAPPSTQRQQPAATGAQLVSAGSQRIE